ncbi:MAG: SDR family NAD(P)-dependent oxidoreductase [Candidatus Binatia bacterium]
MPPVCAGRVALVTGASRGIGAAVARRLAAEGAAVAVTARTVDPSPKLPGTLGETVDAITRAGGRAVAIAADLADPASRARIVPAAVAALGPIDILVNNAAAAVYRPFLELTEKRWRLLFEVNVRAPWELAQAVLPGMRTRRCGWILNISSATGIVPQGPPFDPYSVHGGALLYGTTKAALDRFSAGLAAEVYADGVAVNALSPVAAVHTPGADAHGVVPEDRPDLFEPMEVMVEAALALVTGDPADLTGRVAYSRPLLVELGRSVRGLDGRPLG